MLYYKKYKDAVKDCRPGYTTLYNAKMDMWFNGVAF